MFNAVSGRRGIEGKDIGNGFSNSYFPATFGIQGWHSDWSLSMTRRTCRPKPSAGRRPTRLSVSQDAIDRTGEKDAIFKAFPRLAERPRRQVLLPRNRRETARSRTTSSTWSRPEKKPSSCIRSRKSGFPDDAGNDAKQVAITNSVRLPNPCSSHCGCSAPPTAASSRCRMAARSSRTRKWRTASSSSATGTKPIWPTSSGRRSPTSAMDRHAILPKGESKIGVQFPGMAPSAKLHFDLTVWAIGEYEGVGK